MFAWLLSCKSQHRMTWEAFRSTAANADAESRPEPRRAAPEPESAPRRFAWERGNRSEQNGQRLRRLWLGVAGMT